jgi:hypothetical protein
MLKILNLNKQTNSWRLKEHFNSFTKLVTFQSGIIKVYFNWCVYQFLVSFFEKKPSLLSHDLLGWLTNCSTLCCSLFSLSYLDLLLLAFPWYSWLFVSIVFLQFDSQSPSLSSNVSFSFLFIFFLITFHSFLL